MVVAKCWDPNPKDYFNVPKTEPVRPIDPGITISIVYLNIYLSIYLLIYPSIYIHLSIYLSIYLSILSIFLSFYQLVVLKHYWSYPNMEEYIKIIIIIFIIIIIIINNHYLYYIATLLPHRFSSCCYYDWCVKCLGALTWPSPGAQTCKVRTKQGCTMS